jgi:hypothetical protein
MGCSLRQPASASVSISAANVPGFGRLIEGIQRKKSRETMIISVVVGILVCITIW